jgi:hypothetical protein
MAKRRFNPDRDVSPWTGPYRPYDLLKEVAICFVVVAVLVVGLAVVFGSPDDKAITIRQWSNADAVDFAQTAITELDGTSGTAGYGPPYNSTTGASQKIGPVSLESLAGVHIPIDAARDFVLIPLSTNQRPAVQQAVATYKAATPDQQAKWEAAYEKAVPNAKVVNGTVVVPVGDYGPVGTMIGALTQMAQSGALDTSILNQSGFYGTDYTKSLMFIADSGYFANQGAIRHLSGEQWGMMNETGSFPGQAWLWLYTMWYQIPPFTTSWAANADVLVWALMMLLTLVLVLVPFIPGLRSIPRWTRVYKLVWRDHYKGRT